MMMMMMMMIKGETPRPNPTVHVPPWDNFPEDPTANNTPPPYPLTLNSSNADISFETLTALQRCYPPSNTNDVVSDYDKSDEDLDISVDSFTCDHFFSMYEFKVRKCTRGRSHDWTDCPFAHPGEKARRRDPRVYNYSGSPCPDFRKGQFCQKGDACEYAHGVFECWLHPSRYRTQPCKDGTHCQRRVCFFAHTPEQLRVSPPAEFPSRLGHDSFMTRSGLYSPPSSPPSDWTDSPPISPSFNSVSELADSMHNLQVRKPRMNTGMVMGMGMGMGMSMSPPAWGCKMGFGSPRGPITTRPGFISMPTTPTGDPTRSGFGVFDIWDQACDEEPVMERVESGRDLRAKIYAKLSKENALDSGSPDPGAHVRRVSELVK